MQRKNGAEIYTFVCYLFRNKNELCSNEKNNDGLTSININFSGVYPIGFRCLCLSGRISYYVDLHRKEELECP